MQFPTLFWHLQKEDMSRFARSCKNCKICKRKWKFCQVRKSLTLRFFAKLVKSISGFQLDEQHNKEHNSEKSSPLRFFTILINFIQKRENSRKLQWIQKFARLAKNCKFYNEHEKLPTLWFFTSTQKIANANVDISEGPKGKFCSKANNFQAPVTSGMRFVIVITMIKTTAVH